MVGPSRSQWATLYADGATLKEIARDAGVSHGTVRDHLDRLGIPRRRPGPRNGQVAPPDWHEQAVWFARLGMPAVRIALLVGRSRQAVRWALVQRGAC